MKSLLKIALTAFALAALCGPGLTQDETAAPYGEDTNTAAPARPAPKKAAAKKKTVKKKKKAPEPEPVSEYKFKSADMPQTYKFDKKSNPIMKAKKKAKAPSRKRKKASAKRAKKPAKQPAPRLKKTPAANEETPETNSENDSEEGL